ncbi:MAG TPA: DNA repair exonuclease [Geminicoccaceae bacterium]|nr:DNA repair exonuclease [Geminicoccaceae bacterium]
MRFIHTADWQIGKVFRFVDDATMGVLQEARLEAIATIGRRALAEDAPTVLVAGDVYDVATAEDRTLGQPLERMRGFAAVRWHLIPGNHDPHQPGGPWERVLRRGLPGNVQVHLEPAPVELRDHGAQLLPAPLARRRTLADPTAWMDQAPAPAGTLRIGLAHGSISAFGSDDRSQPNLIDPARPARAGLGYLALGDWHGSKRIGPRCWYSGTPEVDDFGVVDGGHALLVDLPAAGAPAAVTRLAVGRFEWRQETLQIHGEDEVDLVTARLRGLHADPASLLVDLCLEGALSLAGRERLGRALDELRAAVRFLRVDDERLFLSPSADDLDAIAHGGFVRVAAERLRALADDPGEPQREVAARALLRLYAEHRKLASP